MTKRTVECDLRGIGPNLSLYRRLYDKEVHKADDLDAAVFTLQGLGQNDYLSIADLSILAVYIRRLAEKGIPVTIYWPKTYRGQRSRLQRVLEGLRFADLFDSDLVRKDWGHFVTITGRPHTTPEFEFNPETAHYVPMRWLDVSSYDVDRDTDIWMVRPRVPAILESEFADVLRAQGFLDDDAIDVLCQVLLLELGWNSILHSRSEPGTGVGLFCAQVAHHRSGRTRPRLRFCLTDGGRGIPSVLGDTYDKCGDEHKKYHRIHRVSRATGILRFSLDPDTSSRPKHASEADANESRGLAYVVQGMQGRGALTFFSNGAVVRVLGRPSGSVARLSDEASEYPLPCVVVDGSLLSRTPERPIAQVAVTRPVEIPRDIYRAADLGGRCDCLRSYDVLSNTINRWADPAGATVVVDMCCSELVPRDVEHLCGALIRRFPGKLVVLWNLRIEWTVLRSLAFRLSQECKDLEAWPIVCVKQFNDARCVGIAPEALPEFLANIADICPWVRATEHFEERVPVPLAPRVSIPPESYLTISRALNTSMLDYGFNLAEREHGYFVGKINLLTGSIVDRYFAFNQNVRGKPANVERWRRSGLCALHQILLDKSITPSKVVLLGFAGTVREIVANLSLDLAHVVRAYTLLSYDVPALDEVRSVVHAGDEVVLLTDLVSTGTSLKAVGELVGKAGAHVRGVIAFVNARRGPTAASSTFDIDSKEVPLVTCGVLRPSQVDDVVQLQLPREEFWVDPVSLVPVRCKPELWGMSEDVLRRMSMTVEIIAGSGSAKCGHCIDGTRHMSTYVDLRLLLLTSDVELFTSLKDRILAALHDRGWQHFSPTHIVYPAGIARVEKHAMRMAGGGATGSEPQSVTTYKTAAQSYVLLLKRLWRKSTDIQIMRAFDPGGRSRCAYALQALEEAKHPLGDVVVADDAMWTGRTATALLCSAIDAGARRVLIVPLLSRLRGREILHWESLRSVADSERTREVPVCFFFPLVFPVPAYGEQECPYESTIRRLDERARASHATGILAGQVRSQLEARTPENVPARSREFTRSWLLLRCHLELASENEESLANCLAVVREAQGADSMHAMFELLTGEWPLLGRLRVRQALAPVIRERATEISLSSKFSISVRLAAMSFLRSLFPSAFVHIVDKLADAALDDVNALERLVLHVATLNNDLRASKECVRFLDRIGASASRTALDSKYSNIDDSERYATAVVCARRLRLITSPPDGHSSLGRLTGSAQRLLELILEDSHVQHQLRRQLSLFDRSRQNLQKCSPNVWQCHHKEWKDVVQPLLELEFLPNLRRLRDVLLRTGTSKNEIVRPDVSYLVEDADSSAPDFVHDISMASFCLDTLAQRNSTHSADVLADCSRRLWNGLCGDRSAAAHALTSFAVDGPCPEGLSTLGRLLLSLRTTTVSHFTDRLHEAITSEFAHSAMQIQIDRRVAPGVSMEQHTFAQPELLGDAIAHVTSNLSKYAFPDGVSSQDQAKIVIDISERYSETSGAGVHIRVLDNGRPYVGNRRQGIAGSNLNIGLEIFGGELPPPGPASEEGWSAEQEIHIQLW